jgi:hypothetical protein
MVSNQELKERLREKKSRPNIKGYLVCDTCKGSYELQAGEKPEDYSSQCECGGKLTYNRDISPPNKDTKLRNMIILGLVFFVIFIVFASIAIPIIVLGVWSSSQEAVTKNNGTSQDYDQLNSLTTSYDSLENKYQALGTTVYSSKNTNLKSAYLNAQLQLDNTNTTLSNVDSVLSTGQPQSVITKKIAAAQAQLIIAQKSLNNVTSMM